MPRGDRTGPAGLGPKTGRAAGFCAGYAAPGFTNPFPGRGLGPGFGRGMGMGFRGGRFPGAAYGYPYQPAVEIETDPKQEIGMLQNRANTLKSTLEQVQKRITVLEEKEQEK